jgi:hypothetical protein
VRTIYLVGAFFVLFSSLFATLAAWTRMYPDIFGQLGWIDFTNVKQRSTLIAVLAWIIPLVWAAAYLFIKLPVVMILFGGAVGSVMLFLVAYAAICMKFSRDQFMGTGIGYNVAFWISIFAILGVGCYGVSGLF